MMMKLVVAVVVVVIMVKMNATFISCTYIFQYSHLEAHGPD
jgi:hypothetical protein